MTAMKAKLGAEVEQMRRDRVGDTSGLERLKAMEMAADSRRTELATTAERLADSQSHAAQRMNRLEEEIRVVANAQQLMKTSLKEESFLTGKEAGGRVAF